MSEIIHKIKDAITHHHHDADHTTNTTGHKQHKPAATKAAHPHRVSRGDLDLNGAPSATRDPVDLTGRHVEPDHRDIDGRRRSVHVHAPDLIGPHVDRVSVDINGLAPSTHNPPDLNSPTASPGNRH